MPYWKNFHMKSTKNLRATKVREVSDIAALVAARQDRVLPLETLDKLRVNPYLLNQVALNPDMRQQITEKSPDEATNALWKGFLEELDELLVYSERVDMRKWKNSTGHAFSVKLLKRKSLKRYPLESFFMKLL